MYLTDEVAPPKTLCQKFGLRPVFALLRVESPALQPGLAIVRLALAADAAAPLPSGRAGAVRLTRRVPSSRRV